MASGTNDLSYKSIILSFFVDNKLITQRNERIDNGFQFVLDNVPVRNLSQKLQDVVKNKFSSVEMSFMRKWRQCKAKSKEEFETSYEKWIHTDLQLPPSILSENYRQRGSTQTKKPFGQLLLAAANSAKHSNQMDLHYVLKLFLDDGEKASKIRSLLKSEKSNIKPKDK